MTIYCEQHKSKLNLLLGDTSKALSSILRNLRGQSIKEIPSAVRTVLVFLRKILIYIYPYIKQKEKEKKRGGFHLQLFQDISTASSIASYASTYTPGHFPTCII